MTNFWERITAGRTDFVIEFLAAGNSAGARDTQGVSLMQWCAYYGDVSAIKFLLQHGESLKSLGDNYDLNGAVFHGHVKLCEFLIEHGASVNFPLADTGESPLHAALSKSSLPQFEEIVKLLILHGADPNHQTIPGIETGAFMRDSRTKGETPLHRAAAFGSEEIIQLLLDAGAKRELKDMNGDSPLTWASWYLRPRSILKKLCYGDFQVRV